MATFAAAVAERDRLQGFVGVSARVEPIAGVFRVAVHDVRPSALKSALLRTGLATGLAAGTDGAFVGWSLPLEPGALALVY